MKSIILFLLMLLTTTVYSQRYIIIDRKLKTPLQSSDTITKDKMNKGYFAIEKQNIDSLVQKLQLIRERLKVVAREKYDETKWYIGSTLLTIRVVKWTFADRLNVSLSTDFGDGFDHSFYIVNAQYSNKENAAYLKKLIAYIEKGKR